MLHQIGAKKVLASFPALNMHISLQSRKSMQINVNERNFITYSIANSWPYLGDKTATITWITWFKETATGQAIPDQTITTAKFLWRGCGYKVWSQFYHGIFSQSKKFFILSIICVSFMTKTIFTSQGQP